MLYQQYFIEWKSSGILWRKRSVKNSFGPELAHSPHLCGVKLCYVRRYRFTTPTEQCLLILESHHHKRTNTHTEYIPHPPQNHTPLTHHIQQPGRTESSYCRCFPPLSLFGEPVSLCGPPQPCSHCDCHLGQCGGRREGGGRMTGSFLSQNWD